VARFPEYAESVGLPDGRYRVFVQGSSGATRQRVFRRRGDARRQAKRWAREMCSRDAWKIREYEGE